MRWNEVSGEDMPELEEELRKLRIIDAARHHSECRQSQRQYFIPRQGVSLTQTIFNTSRKSTVLVQVAHCHKVIRFPTR